MNTLLARILTLTPEQQALLVAGLALVIVGMALYLVILIVRKRRWR